ncbi:MAG: hypothetical protein HKN34_03210 [Gammaproteobacteria bacterium]|nr:hypothetical protein [Gammaproteobacteria bacterium]
MFIPIILSVINADTSVAAGFVDDQYFHDIVEKARKEQEKLLDEREKQEHNRNTNRQIEIANANIKVSKKPEGIPGFFPTQKNRDTGIDMLILPFKCAEGLDIEWNTTYQSFINGLKPGSKIKAYSYKGKLVDGSLGAPQCFIGECSTNYVSLPVITGTPLKRIVAISKPPAARIFDIKISQSEECEGIPSEMENPYGFNFETLPATCKDLSLIDSSAKVFGQLISFGWQQNNGRVVFQQFFRSSRNVLDNKKKYGIMQDVAYTTHRQYPMFGFTRNKGPVSLLWYERSGPGPVSEFTLRESIFEQNGNIKWVSKYNAGGQLCD